MQELAPGVWQVALILPHVINAYLVRTPAGDVLIDAGTRWAAGHVLRQLRGRPLCLVALTHAHPDHQGSAAEVCRRRKVPLACHSADVAVMEGRAPMLPRNAVARLADRLWSGPPHPVEIRWQGGEMLGDFRVVHTPGHAPGHVVFFREADGVAIVGDVVRNINWLSGAPCVWEPPPIFSVDPAQNRESIRLLASLRPTLVLPGHGRPLRDVAALTRYAATLG